MVVLIKLYKIWYLNKDLYFFQETRVFVWKNVNFDELSKTIKFNIFSWKFAHIFYLVMSTKGCVGFLECVETRSFFIFASNSKFKQNLKKSHTPFRRYWEEGNVCEVLAKNTELQGNWSSSNFSNFLTKYLVSQKQ